MTQARLASSPAVAALSRRSLFGAAALGAAGLALSPVTSLAQAATPAPAGRFAGKVVLITGATSGIGAAAARQFAAAGARVGFCGRRADLGEEVAASIRAAGGEATYLQADVRVPEQVTAFVDAVAARYGRLDIAFNNAGIQREGSLHEQPIADWDDMFLTNVRGVFLAMQAELPHLLAAGGGTIIVTSSTAAGYSRPNLAGYAATKDALQGIVRGAALDYGAHGVRVNALLPGITDTPMIRPPGLDDATWAQALPPLGQLNVDGLQRVATADEMAAAAVALASDDFAYMTGASVVVDGGLSAGRPLGIPSL